MSSKAAIIDPQSAKRFVLVREFLKLNQVEMAKAVNSTQSTIARIENGTRDISLEILRILFRKFNISPIYIISGGVSMVHKQESTSLIKDLTAFREDMEIMKGQIRMLTNYIVKQQTAS